MDYSYTVCNHHMSHCQIHGRAGRYSTAVQCSTVHVPSRGRFISTSPSTLRPPSQPSCLPSYYFPLTLLFPFQLSSTQFTLTQSDVCSLILMFLTYYS